MQGDQPAKIAEDGRFLFSRRLRRILLYVGLFVLYSQLVSTGLTGVYRYSPWELSFVDGGDPAVFDPSTFTLLQPPEGIGTINDLQALGWKIEYSPTLYAVWAILPPMLGSGALLLGAVARRGWPARCLLLLGSCLGIAAAGAIKLHEWGAGSIGWAWDHQTLTNVTLPQSTSSGLRLPGALRRLFSADCRVCHDHLVCHWLRRMEPDPDDRRGVEQFSAPGQPAKIGIPFS